MTNLTIKGVEVGPGWFTVYGNGDHTLSPNMWGTRATAAMDFRLLYQEMYKAFTPAMRELQPKLGKYDNQSATPLENFELFHPKGHNLPAEDHFHILMYDQDITPLNKMMLRNAIMSVGYFDDIPFTDFYDHCDPDKVESIRLTRTKLWEEAISFAKKSD